MILAASKSEIEQSKGSSSLPTSTECGSDFSSNVSGSFEDNGDDSQWSEGIKDDVTFCMAQLSMWFVDIFELSNGGKPNVEITLKIIELSVGNTT